MGYTTDFWGEFEIFPELTPEHFAYLKQFAEIRHMKRDNLLLPWDPLRNAVRLPTGVEGEHFVGLADKYDSQGFVSKDPSVMDTNVPPATQPGLWCQWVPPEPGFLRWDEGEKFYHYEEWLRYLLDHFFTPWGYLLVGEIMWQGESTDDSGKLVLNTEEPNHVQVYISVGHWVRRP